MKSIALSITSDSLVVGEKTLCSVAYAQGKGRKIKELLVRTDRSLWAHYRGKGCCSPGSSMPLSMKCHFMFSSVKLFIFSLPHGSDRCPSDLDKSQEATGAKGLTITSSSTPAFFFFFLVLVHRQMAKDCTAPTELPPLVLGTSMKVDLADIQGPTRIMEFNSWPRTGLPKH